MPTQRTAGTVAIRDAQDLGAAIRAARRAEGWTQAELAARAGVGRQWLVAVEHGHQRAETGMVMAVLRELGLQLSTVAAPDRSQATGRHRTLMTAEATAEAIREELTRCDEDFALRMLARCVADLRSLDDPDDVESFLAPPPSTGDHRWDTLLAASIRRVPPDGSA
jgi:y4mF family transcriptional regulator